MVTYLISQSFLKLQALNSQAALDCALRASLRQTFLSQAVFPTSIESRLHSHNLIKVHVRLTNEERQKQSRFRRMRGVAKSIVESRQHSRGRISYNRCH
jgi:RNA-binding protein YhbY